MRLFSSSDLKFVLNNGATSSGFILDLACFLIKYKELSVWQDEEADRNNLGLAFFHKFWWDRRLVIPRF